jgi:hypothetical protein
MADKDDPNLSAYELQRVVDKIGKLSAALRSSGLGVEVTAHIALSFEVKLTDLSDAGKTRKKQRQSGAKA